MKILRTSPENNHQIYITNLCCSSEEALIRGKLESIPGILDLKFDVVSHQMNVRHTIDPPIILKALQTIGMNGVIIAKKLPALPPLISRQQIFTVCAAGLLLLTGEILNFKHVNSTMTEIVLLFSILVGGRNIFSRALRSAKHLSLDINLLMTVAAIGAVAIGQPGEGAAVIFLFALSLLIESKSLDRTRKAFETLMNLAPQTALVKSDRG